MANSKSVIREIDLQNTIINLNKNKSIISDFNGFNKNTGVWYNGVLSNLYCKEDETVDDIITVGKDVYKITDDVLYKNDVLLKDYSDNSKVKTEILGNINDNVIAYTPQVHIYYEGNLAYVKYATADATADDATDVIVSVGSYSPNTIPYIVIDKAADTWCVLYGNYAICKGMTTARSLSFTPTVALYSETEYPSIGYTDKNWHIVDGATLYNVASPEYTPITLNLSAPLIQRAVTVDGWTPTFKAIQVNSRVAFFAMEDMDVSDTPTVTINKDDKLFNYLKGFIVENVTAYPIYSSDGNAIDMSVVPDSYDIQVQPYKAWNKLSSIKTKFLSYNSYLAIPYGIRAAASGDANVTLSSVDGPTAYLLESVYSSDGSELVTLTGSTASIKDAGASIFLNPNLASFEEADFPKLLGLFGKDYSPEWLYTNRSGFKLIYNRDALVGISKDNNIVVPWNDVDENSLTITDSDIYYYSLNSNAWMHINVSSENKLKALKVGNKLLLNSLTDNCYNGNKLTTYNVDTSLANFVTGFPRVGLINLYGIGTRTYLGDYNLGNVWLTKMLEFIKNAETYYISLSTEDNGPIWATATLLNYTKATNTRKEGWQYTLTPSIDTQVFDYSYYLSNVSFYDTTIVDAYTSSSGSVLSYFKSWYRGVAKYNNKLTDTEKSMTEPTYYNLSPNIDIMTFIDGFNTVALIKVGNNTLRLLVKESELLLVYNLLSNVSNISDYFVLQGQQYGIVNNYINKVDMANGQVVSQTPITSVEGLKFLGNTDKQAFFFSQMNKTILYFAADNTLEFLTDATELDNNNTTTVFAKQTNDIFVLLNDKVVVFTNSGSMYEMLSRAEYITFGDNSWSDGNKTWSYYKISQDQDRVDISLETLWYGDVVSRKPMTVDTVYIELYDDNFTPGTFEISMDSLMNNTVSTKKQVFNVKEKDYDRITKTVYLRFQPAYQNCAAFKLNVNSGLAIKRLAVGYTSEGIPLISKNNI